MLLTFSVWVADRVQTKLHGFHQTQAINNIFSMDCRLMGTDKFAWTRFRSRPMMSHTVAVKLQILTDINFIYHKSIISECYYMSYT